MKVKTYTQCALRKGDWVQLAWIPTEFAVLGCFVEIQGENGWEVTDIHGSLPAEVIEKDSLDYWRGFPSLQGERKRG